MAQGGRGERSSMTTERTLNLILIEDDDIDVMNVRRALERAHVTNPLFVAHNGLEGLELLRSDKVPKDRRLVLLDLNMPKMNGIEFLRELRNDPALRSTSCLLYTSDAADD